jgi:hypothetical protein
MPTDDTAVSVRAGGATHGLIIRGAEVVVDAGGFLANSMLFYCRVRVSGHMEHCWLDDCETVIEKEGGASDNHREGGAYRDLNFHEAGKQGDVTIIR